jgi:hypothetical protein
MCTNQLHLQNPEAPYTADQDHQRAALRSRPRRARAIAIDVAALRRQGVEPVPAFFGIAERYVSGAFSSEQFIAAIKGLRHRPAPVPFRSPPQPASDLSACCADTAGMQKAAGRIKSDRPPE